MTKKDYELIAHVLNVHARSKGAWDIDDLISDIAGALEEDNARFNKDAFYDACYKEYKS
jgi:hypothetical protein